jgi:hypothetical protein
MPRIGPNKSKYHGIYKKEGSWVAKLTIDGKQKVVGKCIWEDEAARIYNAALVHYGITGKRPNIVPENKLRTLTSSQISTILGRK